MPTPPEEIDTRTYFNEEEVDTTFCSRCGSDCSCVTWEGPSPSVPRATMTRDVVIGHAGEHGWPCPATRGQVSCKDAWEVWRTHNGIKLMQV